MGSNGMIGDDGKGYDGETISTNGNEWHNPVWDGK
jgi:hypothetical protein